MLKESKLFQIQNKLLSNIYLEMLIRGNIN